MRSFRPFAILLALSLPVFPALAQNSSSSSTAAAQAPQQSNQLSVQARMRMRREQRRATAIHDAYDHRWDAYTQMGYLRFKPGPSLQRLTWYGWNAGATRYSSERLGITVDLRGYFGMAYVGLNPYSQGAFTRPEISQYSVMAGPTYRFYVQPKYSISGRVTGGWAFGNFGGDTNGVTPTLLGLYPNANTFAVAASVAGEYNVSPNVALRLAPEYYVSGFGSTMQASRGFTGGFVYRFGKQ